MKSMKSMKGMKGQRRKFFSPFFFMAFMLFMVQCSLSLLVLFFLPRAVYSSELCQVLSPKRFEVVHSFPVELIVQFGEGARPETFTASLNDVDITSMFEPIPSGARAFVGPEDGLKILLKPHFHEKVNVLGIQIKGPTPEQDADLKSYFFVAVDQLVTVGPQGGAVQSPDSRFLLNIPPHALPSRITMAVTKGAEDGPIGAAYELSPRGLALLRPAAVTMKYDTPDLPTGVPEDDLFLVLVDDFSRRLESPQVDRATQNVSGLLSHFAKIFTSYFVSIGKTVKDIPPAQGFRLPVGDSSDSSYSCGAQYHTPGKNDDGERLTLLRRTSDPNSGAPIVTFNEKGQDKWRVLTPYGEKRSEGSFGDSTRDNRSAHGETEERFSNGEDWTQTGPGKEWMRPVHAIADGLAIYSGRGFGEAIVLAHRLPTGPVFSIYSHMAQESPCAVGTVIRKGNVIGKIPPGEAQNSYLHFAIAKPSVVQIDAATGEIKVPATWFDAWRPEAIRDQYFDPTNFLLDVTGKYEWDFDVNGNDGGWIVEVGGEYAGGQRFRVNNGVMSVKPTANGLRIESYPLFVDTQSFDSLFLTMRSGEKGGKGIVYFATDDAPDYSKERAVAFGMTDDGGFNEYRVFMGDNAGWKGAVVGIRIDCSETGDDETVELSFDNIRFGRAFLSKIPDTGQTKCYDNDEEIPCPAPGGPFYGQDAHYSINVPEYDLSTVDAREVVIDRVTGLTWQRQDDGTKRTWQEAIDYCVLDGNRQWRLPAKKELQSILSYAHFGPAVDVSYFPFSHEPDGCYWSATTRAYLSLSAWNVCLWDSQVRKSNKDELHFARAVKGRPLEFGYFKDNRDGTITDLTTGLMWYKQEIGAAGTWEDALAYCEALTFAGYDDWRLPNIQELASLVNDDGARPAIDTAYFPGCRPSIYWSGTTHAGYPRFAWCVDFNDGRIRGSGFKKRDYYLRPVRSVR